MSETERMLSINEVAERLSVSPYTVNRWLRDGTLRGSKLGPRVWRVKASELERFIKQGEVEASDMPKDSQSADQGGK